MSEIQDAIQKIDYSIKGLEGDRQKFNDKVEKLDKAIAALKEERQKTIDELENNTRARIKEIYSELADKFEELKELGDPALHEEEVYAGYGEYETKEFPVAFYGKFFSYNDGNIKEN